MQFKFLENLISADAAKTYPLAFSGPERDVLLEEARLGCMQGVLTCLERDIRIAFILGDIFGVTPEAFRKRLSRGRKRMQNFMVKKLRSGQYK